MRRLVVAATLLLAAAVPASPRATALDETCVRNPQVNTGRATLALRVADTARAYFRYVPATYEGVAMPVVVNLHDDGSSAVEHVFVSGLDHTADEHGFVTLTPLDADVETVEAMLDWTREQLCVDQTRVFVTGLGAGGRLAEEVVEELPDVVVAARPVDQPPFDAEAVWSDLLEQPLPSNS